MFKDSKGNHEIYTLILMKMVRDLKNAYPSFQYQKTESCK